LPRATTADAAEGKPAGLVSPFVDLSLPLTTDPLSGAPSNFSLAGDFSGSERGGPAVTPLPAPSAAKSSPWRSFQTVFRPWTKPKSEFVKPLVNDDSDPTHNVQAAAVSESGTASAVLPSLVSSSPALAGPISGSAASSSVVSSRLAYIRSDNVQPSLLATAESAPTIYSTNAVADGAAPPDVQFNGPGGSCGCGGSPDGSYSCPNCGGWQPGTCCTHNPEGSCVLQRLACCLCKPYPDCSNGCVDFCHSWIFHEDDCWLFSNHKCCAEGCGPYPYGTCATDGQGKGSGCGCGGGPCVPPPNLYFTVGALALVPESNARNQTVVTNTDGDTILTTNDLGFDWRVGPSFLLGYRPTPKDAWEISYFGLHDWSAVRNETSDTNDLQLPGALGTILNFTGASEIQTSYSSRIDNAEINYFWHYDNPAVMWMAGFRYFHLDERFDITSTVTGTGSSLYDVRTDNDMGGGQLGVRLRGGGTRLEWDVTAKAGAFDNSLGQTQTVGNFGSAPIRNTGNHQADWAFIGDIGANVSFNFCRCWCAMAGYQVMWVDGLALAPNQLDFTNLPSSGTGLDRGGNVFYQGAHVALGCRW
jgi:hypothetical protein